MQTVLALVVFAFSYSMIASRSLRLLPIGRPAGALLGALLMVATGVLAPEASFRAIDFDTLLLLFAMMLLVAYMEQNGLLARLTESAARRCRSPIGLLFLLVLLAGGLSAFLVNDAMCLVLTPFVLTFCRERRLPMGPYLIALATSANIGSAASLVGNPQNMIIGSLSGYGFTAFLSRAGPAALVGLFLNALLLWLFYGRRLRAAARSAERDPVPAAPNAEGSWITTAACALVAAGFLGGFHLGYTALAGAALVMVTERREPREAFQRVDWTLLVFFASLFIVVAGLETTGLVAKAWQAAAPVMRLDTPSGLTAFTAFMGLGSNLVSNVPMVLLTGRHMAELGDPMRGFVLLAWVTTVAGNLTLLGSVANLIVAEQAKRDYELGFFEYLRFGLLSTLVITAAGVALICWLD